MISRLILVAPLLSILAVAFQLSSIIEANEPDLGGTSGVMIFGIPSISNIEINYPTLDSELNQILDGISEYTDEVEIDIYVSGEPSMVELYVESHGGTVISTNQSRIEASVSVELLELLAFSGDISFIRSLVRPHSLEETAAIPLIRSDLWNTRGYTGSGIKVGVLDTGFQNISDFVGSELPLEVNYRCYNGSLYSSTNMALCETRTDHGTAVSEIITDIAPGIELYISNPVTKGTLRDAVNWMVEEGVDVINHSVGWIWDGPGNGTSQDPLSPFSTVGVATSNDVVWVNAAGNENGNTWTGAFGTGALDGFHYFDASYNFNPVYVSRNKNVVVQLRWDDSWSSPSTDMNLYLFDPAFATLVDLSVNYQNGGTFQIPREYLSYNAPYSGNYNIVVQHVSGPIPDWLQVQIFIGNDLGIFTEGHSIANPAESADPALIAVGAASILDASEIETYSSRGPTMDGRVKPDLVSYDQILTSSRPYNFPGTSAAAPHVAGLAAVSRDRFESYSAENISNYLKTNSISPTGTTDNIWGHGLVSLPFLTPTVPRNVSVQNVSDSAVVSWTAPADEGGSTILNYVVTINPGGLVAVADSDVFSYQFDGMVFGQEYEFSVVAVNGEGEGERSDVIFATAINTPPVVDETLSVELNSVESQDFTEILTRFIDVDTADFHTAMINWGDGQISEGVITSQGSQKLVSGSHNYVDNGEFSITVEIEDSYGNLSSTVVPFVSMNANPVVLPIDSYSWYGNMVMLGIPSFFDPGLNDEHYAILDWGNGATSVAEIIPDRRIIADYVYPEIGNYTVTVFVYDYDGGVGSTQLNVSVFEPLTSIAIPGVHFWVLASVGGVFLVMFIIRKRFRRE